MPIRRRLSRSCTSLDSAGTSAIGNALSGVQIDGGATNNNVGGTTQLLVTNYAGSNVTRFAGTRADDHEDVAEHPGSQ